MDSAAESRIVVWAAQNPLNINEAGLAGHEFADVKRQEVWVALRCGETIDPVVLDGAIISGTTVGSDYDVSRDVEKVALLSEERETFPGKAGWVSCDDRISPLVREQRPTTKRRYAIGALTGGLGFALAAMLVDTSEYIARAGATWSVLALCLLVAIGIIISFVDYDTMFLDLPTLLVGGALAWAAAVVAAIGRGDTGGLKAGIVVAAVWAVGLELTNLTYRLIRGANGLGFGDTLIVIVSAGVPGVVSGEPIVAFASPFAAAVLALLWQLPAVVAGKVGRRHAFALGPFLCAGWAAGWIALMFAGAV